MGPSIVPQTMRLLHIDYTVIFPRQGDKAQWCDDPDTDYVWIPDTGTSPDAKHPYQKPNDWQTGKRTANT